MTEENIQSRTCAQLDNATGSSYGQILKSTTIVGGSQVINILIGIVRTKFMAVLLGPAGVGLMGMYLAVTLMVGNVTGLGIRKSGVRQIAEAVGTGDDTRIARIIITLRRAALVLGLAGMLLTIALSGILSLLTFGDTDYAGAIAMLSIVLLLEIVSGGQLALIQGLRRIADLSEIRILGAFLGTVFSIPIIYVWREAGIVPSLVIVSLMTILSSWWYARKIAVRKIHLRLAEILKEARGLLSLGLVFMVTGLMTAVVSYLARVFIARQLGMNSVGLYQAANTLSSLYIGVILSAMGMDFYPRLTTVAEDNLTCNRMVNEQTEVGVLIATPGILATLAFAPYVIHIFYSAQFVPVYEMLRWQILGVFLRVVSWPMGYILLAKSKKMAFFWSELIWSFISLALLWFGLTLFGLVGIGIAFLVQYISYTVLIFILVHLISGFSWSPVNLRLIGITSTGIALIFLLPQFISQNIALVLGSVLTLISIIYTLCVLYRLIGREWISDFRFKLKSHLGWIKTG